MRCEECKNNSICRFVEEKPGTRCDFFVPFASSQKPPFPAVLPEAAFDMTCNCHNMVADYYAEATKMIAKGLELLDEFSRR